MIKKTFSTLAIALFLSSGSMAQNTEQLPEFSASQSQTSLHMNILASDEMLGRKPGQQGNLVAGRYIAEHFRALGLKPANDGSYFQQVPLETVSPPKFGEISTNNGKAELVKDFFVMNGNAISGEFPVIELPYAWIGDGYNDFEGKDVKGKIILTKVGIPNASSPNAMFSASRTKGELAAERGAVALIEVFDSPMPWSNLARFFGRSSTGIKADNPEKGNFSLFWVNKETSKIFENGGTAKLNIGEREYKDLRTYNIAGVLEGTDPNLKDEYLILSAHFDHIGHGAANGRVTPEDTIFNGARDNVFGVVAMLTAAESFSKLRPKRSIIFVAYTAEEMGLLGSRYYAEHPLVPLNKTVFNMNCDGAGYNDTSLITVIGLDRTGAKAEFEKAGNAFGLTMIDDPAPEQNLFDRSDNVSLAVKGIPAPTYSPGFTAFDAEINKYYHQNLDNPDNIDHTYLLKYAQSYTYAARLIADRSHAPKWIEGDKYEKAFDELYGK